MNIEMRPCIFGLSSDFKILTILGFFDHYFKQLDSQACLGTSIRSLFETIEVDFPFDKETACSPSPKSLKENQCLKEIRLPNQPSCFWRLQLLPESQTPRALLVEEMTQVYETYQTTCLLKDVIKIMPGSFYWKDRQGRYLGCNEYVATLAGVPSSQEVVGKSDFDFPAWKTVAPKWREHDHRVMEQQRTISEEEQVILPSGEQRTYFTVKAPLYNSEGEVIGVLGNSLDITELKEAKEKAEVASVAKSEFIANMGHDIRTPFTGVTGMLNSILYEIERLEKKLALHAELPAGPLNLIKSSLASIQRDALVALGSVDELLQLANEILEVVRLESGIETGAKSEALSLWDVIEHNVELLQAVAEHKKIRLTAEIDPRIPPYLYGIRHYLDRSLLNLMSNALKFTEEGQVKVTVVIADKEIKQAYRKGDPLTLRIQVEDTGIGIPEEKFETIFEYFSRLTPSYQGIYRGSGLGLFTVKKYVTAMNGTVHVDSEVGKGSCFTLTLPLIVDDHSDRTRQLFRMPEQRLKPPVTERPVIPTEAESVDPSPPIKTRALLVEDQSFLAEAMRFILSCLNCEAESVPDEKTAVQKIKNHRYDLIIVDEELRDVSMREVTNAIHAALVDKKEAEVPIIALTSYEEGAGTETSHRVCWEAGVKDSLPKPPRQPALQSILQRWVWGK